MSASIGTADPPGSGLDGPPVPCRGRCAGMSRGKGREGGGRGGRRAGPSPGIPDRIEARCLSRDCDDPGDPSAVTIAGYGGKGPPAGYGLAGIGNVAGRQRGQEGCRNIPASEWFLAAQRGSGMRGRARTTRHAAAAAPRRDRAGAALGGACFAAGRIGGSAGDTAPAAAWKGWPSFGGGRACRPPNGGQPRTRRPAASRRLRRECRGGVLGPGPAHSSRRRPGALPRSRDGPRPRPCATGRRRNAARLGTPCSMRPPWDCA